MLDPTNARPLAEKICKLTSAREAIRSAHDLMSAALGFSQDDAVNPAEPAKVAQALGRVACERAYARIDAAEQRDAARGGEGGGS